MKATFKRKRESTREIFYKPSDVKCSGIKFDVEYNLSKSIPGVPPCTPKGIPGSTGFVDNWCPQPTRKKIFEIQPSRMAKDSSPRQKFNRLL